MLSCFWFSTISELDEVLWEGTKDQDLNDAAAVDLPISLHLNSNVI